MLLYFALALNVSLTRQRTKTGIGTGSDLSGPLNKAVRAHGNAAEYVPVFVTLFLYSPDVRCGRLDYLGGRNRHRSAACRMRWAC